MAEVIGGRIEELIRDRGTSQSALGRKVGLSQPSIARLISGETRETGKLLELARALRTSPEYLTGETDNPDPGEESRQMPRKSESKARDDIVEVAEIDLSFGLGGAYMDEAPVPEMRNFSRGWLRNFTDTPPEELFWARGQGNSMEPTIQEGAIVLIDRRQQSPRMADLIWAFAFGDIGMIKRLRPLPDGSVKILSDNQAVPPETAHDGELQIIGRVVAVVKKL